MGKYDAAAATALKLIRQKGRKGVIRREVDGEFDPVTQTQTGGGVESHAMVAVGLPAGPSASYHIGSLENRNVKQFYVAMAGLTISPKNGDVIEQVDGDWRVIHATVYDPAADSPILAICYAER